MLTNSVKIPDTTNKEFFELFFFHTDQKISQKHCNSDLSSFSDRLTCWLLIIVLAMSFLGN